MDTFLLKCANNAPMLFTLCTLSEQATTFTFLINRFDRVIITIYIYIYTYNFQPLKIQICNRNLFQLPYAIITYIYIYIHMYYIFNYRSSSCLSRAITASSNLTIYVVPLCQCAVTFA